MTLGELITFLEQYPAETVVPHGFSSPHSYRGYYYELAFEPCGETTVGAMLAAARSAIGATYTGYKGGEYAMGEHTDVYLACYGDCGDGMSLPMLQHMVECHGGRAQHHATMRAAALRVVEAHGTGQGLEAALLALGVVLREGEAHG